MHLVQLLPDPFGMPVHLINMVHMTPQFLHICPVYADLLQTGQSVLLPFDLSHQCMCELNSSSQYFYWHPSVLVLIT